MCLSLLKGLNFFAYPVDLVLIWFAVQLSCERITMPSEKA